ncbi:hypothetical protein PF010_g14748 [Phytophthora fragariae]|uniref:Uncharacterized protein n=1 Tax=Phytophthora fragariae TaxID=53985 RepID=A0A6A3RTP2_9STRA|nr:hypothetical protein PF003_g1195 [Phytophthora fragariae]KAE8933479.1 hypothetical protein PF009_g16517 [Phytophthora fragariae]KAE9000241.1 hypothetical protein PF011_g14269 [Phytophthora fragariae]KAE9100123.1 hypothetical protein PF007_g15636 [Phytophthora fragariae]KAE9100623.1 hypothetical protein PF010_g14748 [Phytophthora fragariae]
MTGPAIAGVTCLPLPLSGAGAVSAGRDADPGIDKPVTQPASCAGVSCMAGAAATG